MSEPYADSLLWKCRSPTPYYGSVGALLHTMAVSEPYADSSIGNVTGSNSVNVFLGLGLPWMIAAIYWSVYADALIWYLP